MPLHASAGQPAPPTSLVDTEKLLAAYYDKRPNLDEEQQLVSFGTSGHRGTSLNGTFTEAHILAITQAICDHGAKNHITGPLFVGRDTHALSGPAQKTALEVIAANNDIAVIQENEGFTPTPVISRAILAHNRGRTSEIADGIIITPSHNPPEDGGFKYNPPNGGPADTDITKWIQDRANEILRDGNREVKRLTYEKALAAPTTHQQNFVRDYVADLKSVIDMDAIRAAGISIGVDPLGGAALAYWGPIAAEYGLKLQVVNPRVDPRFSFMTLDHDGKIRMDCSSPHAMASLIGLKDKYAIAWANDPDADRHGIVTPAVGLMNPNHFLAVAIRYLLTHRQEWPASAAVGKTLVSSSLIDRVVASLGRKLLEVPVGFKWFAPGLFDGSCCFGGEESAGASFLRRDGSVWTTDKDGLILGLLAAEITAVTGKDPGLHYQELANQFGHSHYTRIDAPASPEQKKKLGNLSPDLVRADQMAGEKITAKLTKAPGNGASIGGLKVTTENGWFAARPSGTENIYKIYAESFRGADHLQQILHEAQQIVGDVLK